MANRIFQQNVLRDIGQCLEKLGIESFELDASEDQWVINGACKKIIATHAPEPAAPKSLLGFFRKIDKQKPRQPTASHSFHFFGLRLTGADIEQLEQKGRALRAKTADVTVNPHSLPELLRTAGAHLDHRASRLLKLSWHDNNLTLWHVNGLNTEAKEVFTPADLYNQWVHQFKKRVSPTGIN